MMYLRHPMTIALISLICLLGASACNPSKVVDVTPEKSAPERDAENASQPGPKVEQIQTMKTPKLRALKKQPTISKAVLAAAAKLPKCPMAVPGTHPTARRLDGAGAIDFVTDGDVEALRRQVRAKVKLHQDNHIEPGEMPALDETKLDKMTPAQRKQAKERHEVKRLMGTSTVVGEEIDGGMRVKLSPAAPKDMDALFAVIQEHADGLEAAGAVCPDADQRGHLPQKK